MKKNLFPILVAIAFSIFFALIPSYYQNSNALKSASLKTRDALFQLRRWSSGAPTGIDDLLIVAIDDESCERLEARWPWSRTLLASLIQQLKSSDAKTIGLNLSFTGLEGSDTTSSQTLAKALRAQGRVVVGATINKKNHVVGPTSLIAESVAAYGYLEKIVDNDFVIRRSYPVRVYQTGESMEGSFPLQMYLVDQGVALEKTVRLDRRGGRIVSANPSLDMGVDDEGAYVINYLAAEKDFDVISAWKIVQGKFNPADVRGKKIFVGLVSALFSDRHPTPMGSMSGIAIHANEYLAMKSGRGLQFVSLNYTFILSWLLALLVLLLFAYHRLWLGILGALLAVFGLFVGSEALFAKDYLLEPFILILGPLLGLVVGIVMSLLRLLVENKGLETKIIHDKMTGLYNYDFLRARLDEEWKRSKKTKQPLTIVMTDLDRFKKINDTLGHEVGNDMIKRAGGVLKQSARGYDVVARYGGDEFFVLLWKTGHEEAKAYKERLRASYHAMAQALDDPLLKDSSVSIGLSTFDPKINPKFPESPQQMLEEADKDLFTDKESRRKPGEPRR